MNLREENKPEVFGGVQRKVVGLREGWIKLTVLWYCLRRSFDINTADLMLLWQWKTRSYSTLDTWREWGEIRESIVLLKETIWKSLRLDGSLRKKREDNKRIEI